RDLLRPTYGTTLGCYSGAGGQVWNGEKWVSVTKADITAKLTNKELQILLCTDAASEGLNLQAASALINYDLPWNPSKVEQRIGRIDRIGQQQLVLPIRNLFLKDSVDMRVYQALRERCGLFVHFVGKMQPVLALARDALRKPKEAPTFIKALNDAADRVNADEALANTFIESGAEKLPKIEPPVTRQDFETALEWLEQCGGPVRAKKAKGQARWRLSGLGRKSVEITVDRETLERDESVAPLTAGSELVQRLVEQLGLPSRLPLVVGEHHAGAFRCCEARWINPDGAVVVTSAQHLQQLIEAWDGTPPSPTLLVAAQEAAGKAVRHRVEQMKRAAQFAEETNLRSQLEAARTRLLRELGRTLRCVGSGELNTLLEKQVEKETSSVDRYHRALDLLGGYPTWPADLLEGIAAFVTPLSAHDRQARVALPAPLDAAINDPRWSARNPGC
ncbi:MAG: hypothetical protein HY360_03890, partial [Verrucomicrobia bacterium]|nr:hypothetical protein [Verrucomicrobiota bacterium]